MKSRSQTASTYLVWRDASCCPNIGHRRRETSIHCQKAHGVKTRQPITFCFGTRSISRSWSLTVHQQTHQSSTRPHHQELTKPLPIHLKHPRLPSSAISTSFNTLGKGSLQQKAHLIPWISCYEKNSSPRRISTLKNKRKHWLTRE